MRVLTMVLLMAFAATASAQVYRYTDEQGVVHYTDKPPTKDAKPVDLPPLQTYSPQSPPSAAAPARPALPKSEFKVTITSPTPEETFRDPDPEVHVAVSVMPSLAAGFGLVYFVDGTAVTPEPIAETSWTVAGLFRGEHQLSVSLMDRSGKEVARSEPVTVYMMPPTKH